MSTHLRNSSSQWQIDAEVIYSYRERVVRCSLAVRHATVGFLSNLINETKKKKKMTKRKKKKTKRTIEDTKRVTQTEDETRKDKTRHENEQ